MRTAQESLPTIVLIADADSQEISQFRKACSEDSHRLVEQGCTTDQGLRDCISILLVGADKVGAASQRVRHGRDVFTLLVSYDAAVLNDTELLEHCENILVAPFDTETLLQTLATVCRRTELDASVYENIIGRSPQIRELLRMISILARNDAATLIIGETGTGKELVARGIHYSSTRRDHAFVPVNCGALNDELLLAELFGYEKGAFTDAKRSHRGLVDQANGGVLFLDEVDSLSTRAQAALLRFLQEQEYRPLGSNAITKADVRIITASNKDLPGLVARGAFREDLYYRIHLLDILIPPLRQRTGDVEVLAEHFIGKLNATGSNDCKQLHPLTRRWMLEYEWPGNVRELQSFIYRAFALSQGPTIFVPHAKGTPLRVHGSMEGAPVASREHEVMQSFHREKQRALESFEREYLHQVMTASRGNTSLAARCAGKERRAFRRLLDKYRIDRAQYAKPSRQ